MILLKTESKARVRGVFVNGIYYFVLYMLSFLLRSAFFFICILFLLYGHLKLSIFYTEVCSYILPSYHTSGVCQLCPFHMDLSRTSGHRWPSAGGITTAGVTKMCRVSACFTFRSQYVSCDSEILACFFNLNPSSDAALVSAPSMDELCNWAAAQGGSYQLSCDGKSLSWLCCWRKSILQLRFQKTT